MSTQLQEIKNIFIKNRLTEGVDFKRYDWLKGDRKAYIDTKVTNLSTSNYIKTIFDDSGNIGVCMRTWGRQGSGRLMVGNDNSSTSLRVWGEKSSFVYSNNEIYLYDMYFDLLNNKVTINNETYNLSLPHGNGLSFLVFARHTNNILVEYINFAKYKSFEVHNQINLIPCQLLKSIPATLDANNIARSAGECGMYDSVSGKFYGNVNYTGTFTVEGEVEPETHTGLQQIYQNRLIEGVDFKRYDWLRSTGGALIGLNYTNNGNYEIELKGKELKAVGTDASQILGGGFNWSSGLFTIAIRKSNGNLMFAADNSTVYPSAFQEFTLKVTPSENAGNLNVDINNTIYQITKKKLSLTRLFYWSNGNVTQHTEGCVGHLKVDNYCNMYPCTLLRSIPRNLDAQCKERQAGECGMIDLISGKFYGNVANSGTFTVENDNNE